MSREIKETRERTKGRKKVIYRVCKQWSSTENKQGIRLSITEEKKIITKANM